MASVALFASLAVSRKTAKPAPQLQFPHIPSDTRNPVYRRTKKLAGMTRNTCCHRAAQMYTRSMAAVILLPVILMFMGNSRLSTGYTFEPLYGSRYYAIKTIT